MCLCVLLFLLESRTSVVPWIGEVEETAPYTEGLQEASK